MGVFLRWSGAFGLLAATFNATGWNHIRWARANFSDRMALWVFLGLLLAVDHMVYSVATLRSIGPFGIILVVAIFGAGLWGLHEWGLLSLSNRSLKLWLGILALSLFLGVGLSWPIRRQKMSAQASADEIEG
jgi:hypothetical protein